MAWITHKDVRYASPKRLARALKDEARREDRLRRGITLQEPTPTQFNGMKLSGFSPMMPEWRHL